jgi:hypothetical protein
MDEKKKPFPWFYPLAILTLFLLLVLYFFIILVMVHSFLPQFVSFSTFLVWMSAGFLSALGTFFTYKLLYKILKKHPSWQKALGVKIPG